MARQYVTVLAFTLTNIVFAQAAGATQSAVPPDTYPAWRAAAAEALAARGDAGSLATAAALKFLGPPTRPKPESVKAAAAALDLAVRASELAADDPAISWLRLQLCTNVPSCDVRDAATTMRWVAADNGAAWLPTLAVAQKDRDATEVDRVLGAMAEGAEFELYANRAVAMMFTALKNSRARLPARYLVSDSARLSEAMGMAYAAMLPSFSPLINACREAGAEERRANCLAVSKTMQRADVVMAQLVGFAVEKRLSEAREQRMIADRRRILEWRVSALNQSESQRPWLKNAEARSRIKKMRTMPREEDVTIAILRERKIPLEPPEDHR